MTPNEHLFFGTLMFIAGGLAIPGWVLPIRDGIGRFTCRYLAAGFAFAAFAYGLGRDHSWWFKALDLFAAIYYVGRVQHWWRQVELIRKFQRAVKSGKTTIL